MESQTGSAAIVGSAEALEAQEAREALVAYLQLLEAGAAIQRGRINIRYQQREVLLGDQTGK